MKDQITRKSLAKGTLVRVYRNLTTDTFSVQVKVRRGNGKLGWIVIGYCDHMRLDNAHFIVGEKTRQKVIAENKKYVHAYVSGEWCDTWTLSGDLETVTYNPRKSRYFRTTTYYGNRSIDPKWKGTVYLHRDSQKGLTVTRKVA